MTMTLDEIVGSLEARVLSLRKELGQSETALEALRLGAGLKNTNGEGVAADGAVPAGDAGQSSDGAGGHDAGQTAPEATPHSSGSSTSSEGKKSTKAKVAKTGASTEPGPGGRRKWTDEEKADAVDRAKELDSTSSAAEELGIHPTMITRWKREGFGGGSRDGRLPPGNTLPAHVAEDLRR